MNITLEKPKPVVVQVELTKDEAMIVRKLLGASRVTEDIALLGKEGAKLADAMFYELSAVL
tara:strand:+ start:2388 stop:2570 length:183 start_codon:yes stop_codon:yes gene_type:complete